MISFLAQEIKSTPEGKNLKRIIVPTKTLLEPRVRLKCSNKTGTNKAIEPEQEQYSIKTTCSTEDVHNDISKEQGTHLLLVLFKLKYRFLYCVLLLLKFANM